jgi:hypothetical protein
MIAPLVLRDFPTVGPAGERDNVDRLMTVMSALMPRGQMIVLAVQHEAGCPVDDGRWNDHRCTCHLVDVTVRLHDPRRS